MITTNPAKIVLPGRGEARIDVTTDTGTGDIDREGQYKMDEVQKNKVSKSVGGGCVTSFSCCLPPLLLLLLSPPPFFCH